MGPRHALHGRPVQRGRAAGGHLLGPRAPAARRGRERDRRRRHGRALQPPPAGHLPRADVRHRGQEAGRQGPGGEPAPGDLPELLPGAPDDPQLRAGAAARDGVAHGARRALRDALLGRAAQAAAQRAGDPLLHAGDQRRRVLDRGRVPVRRPGALRQPVHEARARARRRADRPADQLLHQPPRRAAAVAARARAARAAAARRAAGLAVAAAPAGGDHARAGRGQAVRGAAGVLRLGANSCHHGTLQPTQT